MRKIRKVLLYSFPISLFFSLPFSSVLAHSAESSGGAVEEGWHRAMEEMMGSMMFGSYSGERGWQGMMGYGSGMAVWGFFGLLTWIAFLVFLILGSVYFWKEINKKR